MVKQVESLNVESIDKTLGATVDVIKEYTENAIPAMVDSIADPTAKVLEWSKRFKIGVKELDARQATRLGAVADVGLRLDTVQRLAASLLLARQSTLRTFRRENLEITIQELRRRVTEQMNEASKDQILEGVVEGTRVIIEKLLKVVFEETIFVKVVILLYKIWGSIRGRINTAPGAQDIMERLLAVLREQNEGLNELNAKYDAAMVQLGEMAKARA
jgi:hypothetical protein